MNNIDFYRTRNGYRFILKTKSTFAFVLFIYLMIRLLVHIF